MEGDAQLQSTSSYRDGEFVVYTRRWFMLLVICLANVGNAMMWISFASVADVTAEFYNVTSFQVDFLSLTYMIAFLVIGLFSSWLIDTWGLRIGVLFSVYVTLIGAVIRILSGLSFVNKRYKYSVVMIGQTLGAIAQPFLLESPTKLAALWFPGNQRAIANTLSTMSNPCGILLANALSPVIVTSTNKLPLMLELYTIIPAIAVILATLGFCENTPPRPPSSSAAEVGEPFFDGLKLVFQSRSYIVLFICMGVGIGIFSALSTVIEQVLCVRGYSNEFSGLCGALMIGCGLIGALLSGVYVDRTKKFIETAKVLICCATFTLIAFSMITRFRGLPAPTILCICLFGAFAFGLLPVGLELAVECTYPVAEATSSGLLWMSGQIFGIICIVSSQAVSTPLPVAEIPYSNCANSTANRDSGPLDMTWSLLFMSSFAVIASCLLVVLFHTPYKRLNAEKKYGEEYGC
ncbi:uncharacterized protein TRIADDRAFT_32990 [Trichoplax adhaerens]|uniref:Major facilitator superfamily (MFS) profile domain-containing protein n=1 Tax=Trichoplax adhaerens TaxID=10228 RepID=B3SBX5_TRIAD|nr:hypothetical protein TRIADDRAFT_32990 [Trichoplax adhaerens]EDV19708.1 hypothetical protein TRIADDRAFT_32990 [Trichoplax adhaerens]|eukprot:XP_002117732.1 hypothetical protein TRIADDRAFT_32990 [Trichoplax adhaerens]